MSPSSSSASGSSGSAVTSSSASVSPLPSPARLRRLLDAAGAGLLEREHAVRLALLAALAGEHVLLVGPPGTAKSALARRLHAAFGQTRYFERLLTRFSTPEELFGPLSLKALEDDRYERLTDGFLPTAGIAFLDEVFKANSAILNALLTLLNEREFDNGTARARTPLVAVIAASNEVPSDEALHAFYDRFLVRVPVAPVGDDHFEALLALPPAIDAGGARTEGTGAVGHEPLSAAEREAVAAAAGGVALSADFLAAASALRRWLAAQAAPISDRRWRQFVGLVRTAAATEGRGELDRIDLWLAPYVAARGPDDVPALQRWFEDEVLALPQTTAPWLERAVQAFERQLEIEESAPAEDGEGDDAAGKLALARAIGLTEDGAPDREPGMQRFVAAQLEARMRRHYSRVHIDARLAQLDELIGRLGADITQLRTDAAALGQAFAMRLWMPPQACAGWLARFDTLVAALEAQSARVAAARDGFAQLPLRAPRAEDEPPAPVHWASADAREADAAALA